jgi:hypothetical protein
MYMQLRELISGMRRWWQSWRQANSSLSELVCCGEYEAERMAHDLGLPVSELRKLAEHGPKAADQLTRRLAAFDLDRDEIASAVPRTLQDLQRVCTMCESHRQCARDLRRDPADRAWEDYCPNVAVLKMLNALPWVARSEWQYTALTDNEMNDASGMRLCGASRSVDLSLWHQSLANSRANNKVISFQAWLAAATLLGAPAKAQNYPWCSIL